jgi:hypothetical protein
VEYVRTASDALLHDRFVGHTSPDEIRLGWDVLGMTGFQAVKDSHSRPGSDEGFGKMASDEPSATSYEDGCAVI